MTDAYNLHYFLDAQEPVYDAVLDELRAGRKASHWIWFILLQIAGLGHSSTAQQFAITSLDEANITLFMTATMDNTLFKNAPLKYFTCKPDQLTIHVLARHNMPRC